jgi:autophagy-related protein 9
MWNHKYHVRPAFYLDPQALSRRFVVCGVAHFIFMPFLLFFITLHFALQNAYDYKSTKQYLGPREWSPVAKWTFREFNELPHIFERRLAPSYQAAEDYLKLFTQSEIVTTVGRILVFCGGSCGAVLFVFAAMNDAILLHVKIADWNLLWYAGMVGIVYSIGKALLPNGNAGQPRRYVRNMYAEMDAALHQVATHTHYYPQVWRARGWDKSSTHKCFSAMFQYKAQLFVHQVMSAILAPYILCVSLPQCSEAICEFVLAVKTELPAEAGEVCG